MQYWSSHLGHVDQCSSSNTFSAPGWALLYTPWLPFRNIIPLCHHALGTHFPTALTSLPHLTLCGSPSIAQLTSGLRSNRKQCPGAPGWEFQKQLCIFQFAWRSFSGYPLVSAEILGNTLDVSVTKPVPGPSPTHYTFGIISCTGANHTEALEELGSCGHLYNVWCASSNAVLLCSLTTIERISGFNFSPFSSLHLVLLASLGVTITRHDSLKAHTPTLLTHCCLLYCQCLRLSWGLVLWTSV